MTMYDLLIRGGTLVTVDSPFEAVADGRTAAIAPDLEGMGRKEVDARELHVFPGGVDTLAHFNELSTILRGTTVFRRSQGRLGTGQPTPDVTQYAGMAEAVETVENR
jgi:dihydroorotase-like cyclic amidohydrolase